MSSYPLQVSYIKVWVPFSEYYLHHIMCSEPFGQTLEKWQLQPLI